MSIALLSCLLLAASGGLAADPGQTGPYPVGFTSYLLIDSSRPGDGGTYRDGRPIPVYLWYPADSGGVDGAALARYPLDLLYGSESGLPSATSADLEKYGIDRAYEGPQVSPGRAFPMLVFSPGLGVHPWAHVSLAARLASHGFVVAVPYHVGDWWWPWEPYDAIEYCAFNRPRDVSFVLDDLLEKNNSPGLLNGALLPDRVAAGGWSLGGYTAMTLAGGDDDVCVIPNDTLHELGQPCTLPAGSSSSPDPRFGALLLLDGSNQFLRFAELARVKVPSLGLGEEWTTLAAMDPNLTSWQARGHAAFRGHPNYRVDVAGTDHASFSDMCDDFLMFHDIGVFTAEEAELYRSWYCSATTPSAEARRLVTKYAVAFLKTQLAGEPGYQYVLTPGYALTREPGVEFFVTERRNPNAIDDEWPAEFVYFPHQSGSEQARAAKDAAVGMPMQRRPQHR